jgi:hypothetical protein
VEGPEHAGNLSFTAAHACRAFNGCNCGFGQLLSFHPTERSSVRPPHPMARNCMPGTSAFPALVAIWRTGSVVRARRLDLRASSLIAVRT